MPSCYHCNATILFGGRTIDGLRYCGEPCYGFAAVNHAERAFSGEEIDDRVSEIHRGPCPICGQSGPIDIRTAYRAVSMIAVTFWKPVTRLSCQRCGIKFLLYNLTVTFFFGWWGVPAGIAVTPIYLCCNVWNLLFPVSPHRPSAELTQHVKNELGKRVLAKIGRY